MLHTLRYSIALALFCILSVGYSQTSGIHVAYNGIATIGGNNLTYGMSPGVEVGYKALVAERLRVGALGQVAFYQSDAEKLFSGKLNYYSVGVTGEFLPYVNSNTITPFVGGKLGFGKLILDAPTLENVGANNLILGGIAGIEIYSSNRLIFRMATALDFNAPLSYKSAVLNQRENSTTTQASVFKPEAYVALNFSLGFVYLF